MSHNSEDLTIKQNDPIVAPLACQTAARRRKSPARPSFDLARRPFLTKYAEKKLFFAR